MHKAPLSSLPQMFSDTPSIQFSKKGEEGNMSAMKMNRETETMHHTTTRPAPILLVTNTFLWVFFSLVVCLPLPSVSLLLMLWPRVIVEEIKQL